MFSSSIYNNQKLGRGLSETETLVDFGFLAQQTFGDTDLETELLGLFVAQARRVVATLPGLTPGQQADAAHLLKGSSRGIGAFAAAQICDEYEQADPGARPAVLSRLETCFAETIAEIAAHLETRGG